MRIALFCHSLLSDWNHGNAHFLRGVVSELAARGHPVRVYEPANAWSVQHLINERGEGALRATTEAYPWLSVERYSEDTLDAAAVLDGADLAIVHEWTSPALVAELGRARRATSCRLLFHDTHHRAVSAPAEMRGYALEDYDAVLAFGETLRQVYLELGLAKRVYTWHEAADIRLFQPRPEIDEERDLVWIGNWGDDERVRELTQFLIEPVAALGLEARIHGVRYPESALARLSAAHIEFAGWLANYEVPRAFAEARLTVHVPRGPYVRALRGIPTIRPFEALACGIPLICSPWEDSEHLFSEGEDYLLAKTGAEMVEHLRLVLHDASVARALSLHGRKTILSRHTCAHRVDELLSICGDVGVQNLTPASARAASHTALLEVSR